MLTSLKRILVSLIFLPLATQAQELPNGGSLTDLIAVPGEVDTFNFAANEAEVVSIRVADTFNSGLSPFFQVFSPSGVNVVNGIGALVATGEFAAPETGFYNVTVSDGTNSGLETGAYEIFFARAPGANEFGPLENGGSFSERTDLGDIDSYTFFANTGDGLRATVSDEDATNYSPFMTVFDPNGELLVNGLGADVASINLSPAPATGVYTVLVRDGTNSGAGSGNYTIRFVRAPGANELGALPNGGSVDDAVDLGDLDSYTFLANADDRILIRAADIDDTSLSPFITLYAPDGELLRNGIGADVAAIELSAPQTGTYTLVVSDGTAGGAGIGDYRLYFALVPGVNEGGLLFSGSSITDSIDLGDIDSYTYIAVPGEAVSIEVSDLNGGSLSPFITVFDPDGQVIVNGLRADLASATFTTDVAGIYTIVVRDGTNTSSGSGSYSLSLSSDIAVLSYAALGDSYSSGEGVPPYDDPNEGLFAGCHRSLRAYSQQIRRPGDAVPVSILPGAEFDFYACSGAVTNNVSADGEGQDDEPPQLDPTNDVDETRDLVTITIGGNDADFVRILAFCFLRENCNEVRPFEPESDLTIEDYFNFRLVLVQDRLRDVLSELRAATPNATVLTMSYPILVSGTECPAATIPFTDLALSESEQQWMRDANQLLNTTTQVVAALVGTHYVDVEDHFAGHEVCGVYDDWVAGFRVPDVKSSFHPTARGQAEYARVINDYLDDNRSGWPFGYFDSGLPRNPPPLPLLPEAAGRTAMLFNTAGNADGLPDFADLRVTLDGVSAGCDSLEGLIAPGATIRVEGAGFDSAEDLVVRLILGSSGQEFALGTVSSDPDGMLNATVQVPSGIAAEGYGSIEVLGSGADGAGYLAFSIVQIKDSTDIDSDGDGIPDSCDNCPITANPDQIDTDLDGLGDECDLCPTETTNDEDGDGLCAVVDVCPLDPSNDQDGDGICGNVDNCPTVLNTSQADADGNGIGDACAALGCFDLDIEVIGQQFGDIALPPTTCSLDGYFESSILTLTATPRGSNVFDGWSGSVNEASQTLQITIVDDTALTATFCNQATFDANGQSCTSPVNVEPVANAGADILVTTGQIATLNGSQSFDPDDRPAPLEFAWSQISGPTAALDDTGAVSPSFVPSVAGVYEFALIVSDGADSSEPDIVEVRSLMRGDVDADGDVDIDDIRAIFASRNQLSTGPGDRRDVDGDGFITVLDARTAVLRCTRERCAAG